MKMTGSKLMSAYQRTRGESSSRYNFTMDPRSESFMRLLMINIGIELDKPAELRVMRSEDAKQFPLIHIKKDGDVGYDLPAIFPYKDEYKEESARRMTYLLASDDNIADVERAMRQSITVLPHQKVTIPTGIHLEIPHGYWAAIEARSSTSQKLMIVPKGVIDEGYRGELFAVLINVGEEPVVIEHGDRMVQLIIKKRESSNIKIVEVDELSPSDRGEDGFGSTGR